MKSDRLVCYRCGSNAWLEHHHLFNGQAYRHKADEDGLWIWLCRDCHAYLHTHSLELQKYKELGQKMYEQKIGTHEEVMERYHHDYLRGDDDAS